MIKNKSYKYLLNLYSKVNDFLSDRNANKNELPDIIVSFCIVTEKILKIKLHKRHPALIFNLARFKDDNTISMVVIGKEDQVETANFENILNRFEIVYKKLFTEGEIQTLQEIYKTRNFFIHGYKSDDSINFDYEDIIKKLGLIWIKVSQIAIALFGKENIKDSQPRKKYTKEELDNILEEEVEKMIKPINEIGLGPTLNDIYNKNYNLTCFPGSGNRCPRCGSYSFYSNDLDNDYGSSFVTVGNIINRDSFLNDRPVLYKCNSCHLQLTERQYKIAKKISPIGS